MNEQLLDPIWRLGLLAMKFRSNKDEEFRRQVAQEYAQEVKRLIATGTWTEMPAFEDMLSTKYMPKEFYDYWKITNPNE